MSKNRVKILILGLMLPIMALGCSLSIPFSNAAVLPTTEAPVDISVEPTPVKISLPPVVAGEEINLSELYAQVNPSVVNILTYGSQDGRVVASGQGSGFVYDADGHVVTNAHVVHGADEVEVIFSDGTIEPAEIIGEDLHSDLAVVAVNEYPAGVQPIPLGRIEDVVVGQQVIAIGNPFGLGGTLTSGIVSALGRTIPALTPFSIPESIQTDASINPGNSGGPLLNLRGEVIGVNAQIETDGFNRANSGVGFAVPVSILERVVPELIQNGEFKWAWLGVVGGDLTPIQAEAMNLPVEFGAYISQIAEGGPSEKANLRGTDETIEVNGRQVEKGGDVITAINGQPVRSFGDLLVYISLMVKPGEDVTLTLLRDGEYVDVSVNLEERPDTIESSQVMPFP